MKPATAAVGRLLVARGVDGLTDAEARAELHQTRLAARVGELRAAGWSIGSLYEQTGDGTRYARYFACDWPGRRRAYSGAQEAMAL